MGVIKTEYSFISSSDGLSISALRIEPENKNDIVGVLQLVHGMCEHKERYIDFMNYLAERGYVCAIHDHRGHGQSVKSDDDLGFMYEGGYKALIEDTYQHTQLIKEHVKKIVGDKKLPYNMLGHSMGSLVVRCYLKKYDSEIDKLAVLGCPSEQPGMGMALMIAKVMGFLLGKHGRSKFGDQVMSSRYENKFKSENLKGAWLNTDRNEVNKYNADKYCNFSFTMDGYENLVRLNVETYSKDGYKVTNKELPVKFFSGADDPCAISEADIDKAVNTIRSAGYINVSRKLYPGLRHEILLAPEKMQVYEDIYEFISPEKTHTSISGE